MSKQTFRMDIEVAPKKDKATFRAAGTVLATPNEYAGLRKIAYHEVEEFSAENAVAEIVAELMQSLEEEYFSDDA